MTHSVNANYNMKRISTHTLTWSVTGSGTADNVAFAISTHTLTWSVTIILGRASIRSGNFNSHAHVERDYSQTVKRALEVNFNSHAHVERDIYGALYFGDYDHFNSHAHVERDNWEYGSVLEKIHFNSHAHVERDVRILFRH